LWRVCIGGSRWIKIGVGSGYVQKVVISLDEAEARCVVRKGYHFRTLGRFNYPVENIRLFSSYGRNWVMAV